MGARVKSSAQLDERRDTDALTGGTGGAVLCAFQQPCSAKMCSCCKRGEKRGW